MKRAVENVMLADTVNANSLSRRAGVIPPFFCCHAGILIQYTCGDFDQGLVI